ncbi:hypothetical protein Lalb_Chr01g0007481 [Lupinus albus]|uniref:Uncharacterized protein n=1 Tax=Lupinus albus TaxID=3870 RepID=A0A6A4R472_LUPAL|nr:hypothetical protein Lalb_Chr01g0007481 [Lupinus albus]
MEAGKSKHVKQEANIDTGRWRSEEFRKSIVKKIIVPAFIIGLMWLLEL